MTDISALTIPTAARASLESVIVWAGTGLARVGYSELCLEERNGASIRVANAWVVRGSAPDVDRVIIRASIPLAADWQGNGSKIWVNSQQVTTVALPTAWQS